MRGTAGRSAPGALRIRAGDARPGHLRSLRALRMTSWIAVPLAGLTVVSTLAGGLFALRLRDQIGTIIALSGGVVVAVALFDVLPEAIDALDDGSRVGGFAGLGFLVFFLAHRILVLHHRDADEQAQGHAQVGALGAAGSRSTASSTGLASVSPST